AAGFDHARGRVVVTLDADLQNPPEEIPRLLAKLHEGYDLVSGWRKDRRDESTRSFLSRTANRLIGSVTGVPLHDYGCTLKAYRREILDDIELYGELHRFLPALGAWAGARIAEIEVAHNPRTAGRSHYGSERILKVFFDLITVKLLMSFSTKPAYVFGLGGVVTLVTSVLLGLFAIYRKIFLGGEWMSPITIISIVFFPLAVQFFLLGFIAEIATRAYHGARRKKTYAVRTRVSSAEGEISRRDRPPD
ncbi:MAG: glycosyltransferase, partial [Candidatus Hydrogenedentota bacterium]